MEITNQDKQDIRKTIELLQTTSEWIDEIVDHDKQSHHQDMQDAIDVACEWLERLIKRR